MAAIPKQGVLQVKVHNLVFHTLILSFTHLLEPETIESFRVGVILLRQYSSVEINAKMN